MTRRLAMGGKQLAAATALNPFTQLPPELSFHIISFLSYKDALSLAQVPPSLITYPTTKFPKFPALHNHSSQQNRGIRNTQIARVAPDV
jgi:hypothetical protein